MLTRQEQPDVPSISSETIRTEPLAGRLLERQYADWRDLRFEEFGSIPVKRELATLAENLVEAISRTTPEAPQESTEEMSPDKDLLDQIVQMEAALPRYLHGFKTLESEVEEASEVITSWAAYEPADKTLRQRGYRCAHSPWHAN